MYIVKIVHSYIDIYTMNQALSKSSWSLEVWSKIFLGLKGHFHRALFLIYVLQKKPYQMDLYEYNTFVTSK